MSVRPSPAQLRVLQLLSDSFQLERFDGSFRVRQTLEPVPRATLAACLARRWITDMPGLPLFDQECRLTTSGAEALAGIMGAPGLTSRQTHPVP
jgi:hypothetical protein